MSSFRSRRSPKQSGGRWCYDVGEVSRATELVSRMLNAVKGQAFGELAGLAGANAAEKRAVAGSRTL